MKGQGQKKKFGLEGASGTECRAEFIFYARNQTSQLRSVEVLGDYACDFRRPDWAHR